jgi:hypothetical protein
LGHRKRLEAKTAGIKAGDSHPQGARTGLIHCGAASGAPVNAFVSQINNFREFFDVIKNAASS